MISISTTVVVDQAADARRVGLVRAKRSCIEPVPRQDPKISLKKQSFVHVSQHHDHVLRSYQNRWDTAAMAHHVPRLSRKTVLVSSS